VWVSRTTPKLARHPQVAAPWAIRDPRRVQTVCVERIKRADAGTGGAALSRRTVDVLRANLHRLRRRRPCECAKHGNTEPCGKGGEQASAGPRQGHRLRKLVEVPRFHSSLPDGSSRSRVPTPIGNSFKEHSSRGRRRRVPCSIEVRSDTSAVGRAVRFRAVFESGASSPRPSPVRAGYRSPAPCVAGREVGAFEYAGDLRSGERSRDHASALGHASASAGRLFPRGAAECG
jgi:hypothetical protein